MITLRTIDAHVAGAPLRLAVDGFPAPRGATMEEKRVWASRRSDALRRILMLEPRGHADMHGAVLTEPTLPGSDAGVLFMRGGAFPAMTGHAIVAVATIALERGLLLPRATGDRVVFDTPAGIVRASARRGGSGRVEQVSFTATPSFVLAPGVEVTLPHRRFRADVAYGGEFLAIVDAESAGVTLDAEGAGMLRRLGKAIIDSVDATVVAQHPVDRARTGLAGTIFTGPPEAPGAHLRCVTVYADGTIDRSPGGTGTAALMAVLDAMGLLAADDGFMSEGLTGHVFRGRLAGRTQVGGYDAVVPEISGTAFITGEHAFIVDDEDPLGAGFALS